MDKEQENSQQDDNFSNDTNTKNVEENLNDKESISEKKEDDEKEITPEELRKASHHEIRGIRRCQNAECGAILHRDRNGACCIAINCRRIWCGEPPIRKLTAEDIQLEKLQCAICLE